MFSLLLFCLVSSCCVRADGALPPPTCCHARVKAMEPQKQNNRATYATTLQSKEQGAAKLGITLHCGRLEWGAYLSPTNSVRCLELSEAAFQRRLGGGGRGESGGGGAGEGVVLVEKVCFIVPGKNIGGGRGQRRKAMHSFVPGMCCICLRVRSAIGRRRFFATLRIWWQYFRAGACLLAWRLTGYHHAHRKDRQATASHRKDRQAVCVF